MTQLTSDSSVKTPIRSVDMRERDLMFPMSEEEDTSLYINRDKRQSYRTFLDDDTAKSLTSDIKDDYEGRLVSFVEEQENMQKNIGDEEADSSSGWTIFNLWNDILTAGSICVYPIEMIVKIDFPALPFYLNSIGVIIFPFVLICFAVITAYTLNLLYRMSKKFRKTNLPILAQFGLGNVGYLLTCLCMFAFNFGGLVGNLIILGEIIPQLIVFFAGQGHTILTDRHYVLLVCCLVFLPLSFAQNISKFKINSFLSIASILGLVIVLFVQVTFVRERYDPQPPEDLYRNHVNPTDFMAAFGGLSYLFVCHDLSFNVFGSLRDATRSKWYNVNGIVMIMTVITFAVQSYSGFFLFYHDVKSNILSNFSATDVPANVARILLVLTILISVPYQCFMPRVSLYSVATLFFGSPKTNTGAKIVNTVITLIVVLSALLIAEFVTDLGKIYGLAGGVAAAAIAFVFPPLLFLKLEKGGLLAPKKIVAAIVLVIGIIIMCVRCSDIGLDLGDLMLLASDPYLALVLSNVYRSSDVLFKGEGSESQKEIPSHLEDIGIGMYHQSATKKNKETWTRRADRPVTAEEGGLKRLVVPANHFLLSTQRNKPTTASQPQQPWNILTWIFTETQVATAECLPPQALFRTRTHGLRSLLINNTWAYLLFGTSLGAKLFTAPPIVTRSTLESSIWAPQQLHKRSLTVHERRQERVPSHFQRPSQTTAAIRSQTDNRWMMYGYDRIWPEWSNPFEGLYGEGRRVSDEAVVYGVWPYPAQVEHRRSYSFSLCRETITDTHTADEDDDSE
ncbi:hypothetical protein PROFUN_07703 [Planoprotostelium fungivorum]|uniref:Amino acid transporter transmembrane domain-containing protein n=1 Tax=Planoprotostelium fungivorum TaxID=1890364 RepID=A0A2P6MM74_9EUKA|nr:hypothetical protein PROFUN_07703 [Planoprotostelium fungivorum]